MEATRHDGNQALKSGRTLTQAWRLLPDTGTLAMDRRRLTVHQGGRVRQIPPCGCGIVRAEPLVLVHGGLAL